eukprot:Lithocolla_globosa_v1_NODE_259_length_4780_cov_16.351111.p4 type:complete len:234 gc:universal NODE_259_length_4780_cov_16.351111:1951-1250(-)
MVTGTMQRLWDGRKRLVCVKYKNYDMRELLPIQSVRRHKQRRNNQNKPKDDDEKRHTKDAPTNPNYKTVMCRNQDSCKFGNNCKFAHSRAEIRPQQTKRKVTFQQDSATSNKGTRRQEESNQSRNEGEPDEPPPIWARQLTSVIENIRTAITPRGTTPEQMTEPQPAPMTQPATQPMHQPVAHQSPTGPPPPPLHLPPLPYMGPQPLFPHQPMLQQQMAQPYFVHPQQRVSYW